MGPKIGPRNGSKIGLGGPGATQGRRRLPRGLQGAILESFWKYFEAYWLACLTPRRFSLERLRYHLFNMFAPSVSLLSIARHAPTRQPQSEVKTGCFLIAPCLLQGARGRQSTPGKDTICPSGRGGTCRTYKGLDLLPELLWWSRRILF